MRAVIQRVLSASVTVDGQMISSIGEGLCVLIGISKDDTVKDIDYMVQKLLNLRLFDNEDGKRWRSSVVDKQYEILCISQFTLYYNMKGNKPDFHHAMSASFAEPLYNNFLQTLRSQYKIELIKDGKFGSLMEVNIVNDGPVTMQLESPKPKTEDEAESIPEKQSR